VLLLSFEKQWLEKMQIMNNAATADFKSSIATSLCKRAFFFFWEKKGGHYHHDQNRHLSEIKL